MVSFTWFDLIHKQWSADGLSAQTVLVHSIINVLDQLVADFDVLSADGRYGLWIPVRLLVWLIIIIIMITEPRQESTHDGPARKHLRVNNLSLLSGVKRISLI